MKTMVLSVCLAAACAFTATAAYSQECPREGMNREGARHGGMMFHRGMESAMFNPDFLQERLGLTDDQVDRINAINDRFRKERQAVMEKIRPGERALRKILRAETPDADKAQPIVNELAGLHAQMRMIGIRHHIEIDKVLTADQRTKMRRPGARSSMPSGGAKGPIGFAPGAMGMPGDEPADDCGFEESES